MMIVGAMSALVTPFKNGKIDVETYASLLKRQIKYGMDACVPAGTTGESATMSHAEHKECIEIAVSVCREHNKNIESSTKDSNTKGEKNTKEKPKDSKEIKTFIDFIENKDLMRNIESGKIKNKKDLMQFANSLNAKDSKNNKDSKDLIQIIESMDSKKIKNLLDALDSKKDSRDLKQFIDSLNNADSKKLKNSLDSKDSKNLIQLIESIDSKKIKNLLDALDSKKDSKDLKQFIHSLADSKQDFAARQKGKKDSKDLKQFIDSLNTADSKKLKNALSALDNKDSKIIEKLISFLKIEVPNKETINALKNSIPLREYTSHEQLIKDIQMELNIESTRQKNFQKNFQKNLIESNAHKKIKVLAGAGSNNTIEAIELAKFAQKCGADAILSVAPYYNKPSEKGLVEHYLAIANAVEIPIMLYNVPSRSGCDITPKVAQKLFKNAKNIYAIKEASGSMERVITLSNMESKGKIFSGDDILNYPILAYGGSGVISVTGNLLPKEIADLTHFAMCGEYEKALDLSNKLYEINKVLFIESNPMPIKAAMWLSGLIPSLEYRLPLVKPSKDTLEKLEKILQNYEVRK